MAEVLAITGMVVVLFYIFFIRPARAEQSHRRKELNELRIGDQILTRGGLIATVVDVETPADGPMVLHLEFAEGVVIKARTEAVVERIHTVDDEDDFDDGAADELDDGVGDDLDDGFNDDDEESEDEPVTDAEVRARSG